MNSVRAGVKFCSNCGKKVKATDKFCAFCGSKISSTATKSQKVAYRALEIYNLKGEQQKKITSLLPAQSWTMLSFFAKQYTDVFSKEFGCTEDVLKKLFDSFNTAFAIGLFIWIAEQEINHNEIVFRRVRFDGDKKIKEYDSFVNEWNNVVNVSYASDQILPGESRYAIGVFGKIATNVVYDDMETVLSDKEYERYREAIPDAILRGYLLYVFFDGVD
ncbi:MAG: zinc-ribbon domain-containing protein [Candidatus Saccharimonadales bacterium]